MTSRPEFVPSRPRPHLLRRLWMSVFALIPLVVWLGGIAGVLWLAGQQTRPLDHPGVATVQRCEVHAPVSGILKLVLVKPRELVTAGQIIGQFDGAQLELRSQAVEKRIHEIRAEIERERLLYDSDLARRQVREDNELRRYQRDLEDARLDSLEVQARLEERRVRLDGLEIELKRLVELNKIELTSEAVLVDTRTRYAALRERIKQSEAILAGRSEQLKAVEARLADYEKRRKLAGIDMDVVLGNFRYQIEEQGVELEIIKLQRLRLAIRAPAAGRVVAVSVVPQQTVEAGAHLVSIVDPKPAGVLAYLPPGEANGIEIGMAALIERSTDPGRLIRTKVLAVGPAVVQVPQQAATLPNVPEWRLPVHLDVVPDLVPGEFLRVRLLPGQQ